MLNGSWSSRGEGGSALSANDHLAPQNIPILDFDSCGQGGLEFGIVRLGTLEGGVILHVHHLDDIPRDGDNLCRSLIDHRNFRSAIYLTEKRRFLNTEEHNYGDPTLCRSRLACLRLFILDDSASL